MDVSVALLLILTGWVLHELYLLVVVTDLYK